jgi:hypothetical protein
VAELADALDFNLVSIFIMDYKFCRECLRRNP